MNYYQIYFFLDQGVDVLKKIAVSLLYISLILLVKNGSRAQDMYFNDLERYSDGYEIASIKTVNGKFYAYIVLLYNENPHFVNLIQKDSIPMKVIGNEGFNVKEYKQYINSATDLHYKDMAQSMLDIYLEPSRFSDKELANMEQLLVKKNVILKFSRDKNTGSDRIMLDYCIFGKKNPIDIVHPLIEIKEKMYNIHPFIYYDEFSTSNSTFYYDMIYINQGEVNNDFYIAQKVLGGENVNSMFFVGSKVTENIKYCLIRSFSSKSAIREEIFKMFVIHELTHKMLNNRFNNFDQVTGEELSLTSTIFSNPYLGLAVMYAYLNYNSVNPHRIAALNFLKFVADKTGKNDFVLKPGLIKHLSAAELRKYSKENFEFNIGRLTKL